MSLCPPPLFSLLSLFFALCLCLCPFLFAPVSAFAPSPHIFRGWPQTFLSVRRVRLLEDLMLLDLSLGGGGGGDGAEEEQKWRQTDARGIRNDNNTNSSSRNSPTAFGGGDAGGTARAAARTRHLSSCLLYTSDAADE